MHTEDTEVEKNKKFKIPKIQISDKSFLFLAFLIPMVLYWTVSYLQWGTLKESFSWTIGNLNEAFLNYVIAFAIINLFLVISRNKGYVLLSSMIISLLSGLAYISHIKNELRGEPLTILDYKLLSEASNISVALDRNLLVPLVVLSVSVLLIQLFVLLFVKMKITSQLGFALSGVSVIILWLGLSSSIDTLAKMNVDIPADVSWNHNQNGFMLATLIDSKFLDVPEPKNYNEKTIREVYEKLNIKNAGSDKPKGVKPNVLFVMSESFWDPQMVLGLKTNQEVIPNFRALSKEGIHGLIEVPGIGGGTANSEYEILTGLTRNFIQNYSVPYNPYNSYIHNPIRSLATVFSEEGYETTAIHTYQSWFYRRNDVYKQLGFDKFLSLETLPKTPKIKGLYSGDDEVNSLIMHQLTRSSETDFIYAVTMQGHGPYEHMTSKDEVINIQNDFDDKLKKNAENYLNNLHSVDEELGHLVNELKTFNEPTILVYFGDHIPPLGEDVYNAIGFNIYEKAGKKTPALIWSNYQEMDGEFDFHSNMLGPYLLNEIGFKSDMYLEHLYAYSKVSPEINPEDDNEFYRNFELLHYDIMHGKQYFYDLIGKPQSKEEYQVGYPLKLEHAYVQKVGENYVIDVIGEGISWMTDFYVNDVKVETQSKNDKRVTFTLEREDIGEKGSLSISAKMMDNRDKVIKVSNELHYGSVDELKKHFENNNEPFWNIIELDEQQNWEFFSSYEKFQIVRLDVGLKEIPYYISGNGLILTDKLADDMDDANLSDIYENGYLYISISNNDSGWKGLVQTEEIKAYFEKNNYQINMWK